MSTPDATSHRPSQGLAAAADQSTASTSDAPGAEHGAADDELTPEELAWEDAETDGFHE